MQNRWISIGFAITCVACAEIRNPVEDIFDEVSLPPPVIFLLTSFSRVGG